MVKVDMKMPKCCPCELAGSKDIPCAAAKGIIARWKKFQKCRDVLHYRPRWCMIKGEIVQCKDCRYTDDEEERTETEWCMQLHKYVPKDWYCADGKRKERTDETD